MLPEVKVAMTKPEIAAWLEMLGSTPTNQLRSIEDLLIHADADHMSSEDRAICLSEAKRLRTEIAAARAAATLQEGAM